MTQDRSLRVAVYGAGPAAGRWAAAFEAELLDSGQNGLQDAGAVVVAPGAEDPFGLARQALLAGLPVLCAAGTAPNPWQAAMLNSLCGPGGPFLRYFEPFQYRGGFALLRRFLRGPEPFWRPLYLRAVSLTQAGGKQRVEELAWEQMAAGEALLGDTAEQVTAEVVRGPDSAEVSALFVSVRYAGGTLVRSTVSVAEGREGEELVAVTASRTFILESDQARSRLRIVRSDHGQAAQAPRERVLTPQPTDAVREEAACFLEAARRGDVSAGNSDRWSKVAALSWAVRQSITRGGAVYVAPPPFSDTETPPLSVIEGGGGKGRIVTLVAS